MRHVGALVAGFALGWVLYEVIVREPLISGDEQDAVTGWRRFLSWRVGERAKIKRKIRRRERHKAKEQIRKEDWG